MAREEDATRHALVVFVKMFSRLKNKDKLSKPEKIGTNYRDEYVTMRTHDVARLGEPNFYYKPTGLAIWWNKYIDSKFRTNRDVTMREVNEMILTLTRKDYATKNTKKEGKPR